MHVPCDVPQPFQLVANKESVSVQPEADEKQQGTRTSKQRRMGMPTRIPHTRHPASPIPAPIIIRLRQQVCIPGPRVFRRLQDIYFARQRSVQVPDIHAAVVAARVHIARVGAAHGREVTSNQRLEHLVSAKRDDGAVVGVRPVLVLVVGVGAVFKARRVGVGGDAVCFLLAHHLAQVPQFGGLVFAVAEHVAPIAFAVDVGQALGVAEEDSGFPAVAHAPAIPYLERGVVGTGVEDVGGLGVAKAYRIHVVLVAGNAQDGLAPLDVVDVNGAVACASHDFTAVA